MIRVASTPGPFGRGLARPGCAAIGVVWVIACLFCSAAALPSERSHPLPGVGGADPRTRVDGGQAPWRAVARLQVPGVSRCTAVVLAPRLAVTAAHCLWSRRLGGWVPAGMVHVLTGYAAGAFSHHMLAVSLRIAPGYDPADTGGTRGADLALVTLAAPAGDVLSLATGTFPPGTAAVLGGYNQDRAEVIEADPHCAVTGITQDRQGRALLLHDCSATRGTSGGPLLAHAEGGGLLLAGIQVGSRQAEAGGVAIPAEAVRRLLAQP